MKTIFIAITVTSVVIAGIIIRVVGSAKGKDSREKGLPDHDPDRVHELTTDFLL